MRHAAGIDGIVSRAVGSSRRRGTPFGVLAYQSRTGKFGTIAGRPSYTVAYHATSMDVVFS